MITKKIIPIIGFFMISLWAYSFDFNQSWKESNNSIADVWHVKAVHPSGQLLGVKAIDKNGFIYSVKAFHKGSPYMMDVKATINGKEVPIKVLKSADKYAPVKAIGMDGTIYDIKAIDLNKKFLDVKGISQSGNVIHIKAIGPDEDFYPIKAISTSGNLLDIKGISFEDNVEKMFNGVELIGHVKALPQLNCSHQNEQRMVKAFHPMGEMMDVNAIDADGNLYPLIAIANGENIQLIDIKVEIDGSFMPVKVMLDDEKYHKVKAILPDGTMLDIKAIDPYEDLLEIRAVNRQDNILAIKALGTSGNFYGVKAISKSGYLHDIKGIKLKVNDLEAVVNKVKIHAHVKAFPQIIN